MHGEELLLLDVLDDLQHLHGAGLGADAAGDALGGGGGAFGKQADVEGADLDALAAAHAELLVDHVDALGVLGDGLLGAVLGALAALDADLGDGLAVLLDDGDAGLVLVELLIESLGAGLYAGETSLALDFFFLR